MHDLSPELYQIGVSTAFLGIILFIVFGFVVIRALSENVYLGND